MSEDLEFAFSLVLSGASIGLMYSLIALGFLVAAFDCVLDAV